MTTIEELAAEVGLLRQRVESSESVLAIQALKARYGELVDRRFSAGAVVDESSPFAWRLAQRAALGAKLSGAAALAGAALAQP